MSEWRETTLEEIIAPLKGSLISGPFGSNISSKYFVNTGVPVIRGNNLSLDIGTKFIDKGFIFISQSKADELNTWAIKDDIIFTAAGTIGQVGLIRNTIYGKYIISNKQIRLRIDTKKALPLYIYYWCASSQMMDRIISMDTGSTIPLINLSVVRALPLLLPTLPTQRAIAEVLSSLDDKIELLTRQSATLEALAQTYFRQWFVEGSSEAWEEVLITNLFEVKDGTHDSPKPKEYGKKLITSKHLSSNSIDFDNAYYISEIDYEQINRRSLVETGDILFSMIGTIGTIYLEQSEKVDYAIKNIGLFKTSQNLRWKYFLYLWLKSDLGKEFIHVNRDGSTQEYISLGSLRNIKFIIPSSDAIDLLNETVSSYFSKIKANQHQIQTLQKLRNTLLPKLISGEVRVKP